MPEIWAVIPAAGVGARMQSQLPKQYLPLAGKTVIEHCMAGFLASESVTGMVVAVSPEDAYWQAPKTSKTLLVADGGSERGNSVLNALEKLHTVAAEDAWVLVHDAARPCLSAGDLAMICQRINAGELGSDGGILALPVADTLKRGQGDTIQVTVDRNDLWRALTPQCFPLNVLRSALRQALQDGIPVTDEASAMEAVGAKPKLMAGQPSNIKITYPQDLALAELYLQNQ